MAAANNERADDEPPPGAGFDTASDRIEELPAFVAGEIRRWFASIYVVLIVWPFTVTVLSRLNPDPAITTCEDEPAVTPLGETCTA